jgi:CIC family chloride channel protein
MRTKGDGETTAPRLFGPTTQQRIREQWEQIQPFSLIFQACAVGVLTGGGAIAYAELINFVQWCALGSTELPLYVLPQLTWYHIILTPTGGGLLVALVSYFLARGAKGHGVPEVMEAVTLGGGRIPLRSAMIKALTSALTIGTGGSVGREGPMVHIGASLGSVFGLLLRVPPSRLPVLAGCGVAGGIAAAFNAPIAGAFFALEVVMGNFAMPAFGPVMLSSVFATVVSRTYFGNHPAFVVPGYTLVSAFELPFYLLLGVACGVGGLIFITTLDALERGMTALPLHSLLKPVLGGLVLGGIVFFVPNVYGIGYATMDLILRGGLSWQWLLLLLPVKMGATSLTLASGGAGGLFLPALYLGAIIGGLFGFGVGSLFPSVVGPSGGYALVGMSAFLAGVIHCPITAFLLLFELTNDYHIILPLMVSVVMSTLFAKFIREESIYTLQLMRRGINIRRREENVMHAFTVRQVMHDEGPTLHETAPFSDIVQYFLVNSLPLCFVLGEDHTLRGVISIHDVKVSLQEETLGALVIAKDLAQTCRIVTRPDETLAQCLEKFARTEQEYLPVISETGKLQGVISRRDVLDLYNQEILRHEYLGIHLRSEGMSSTVSQQVRLPREYTVDVIPVPPRFTGGSLREAQLRTRFHLTVVAIRRGGFDRPDELPDPDWRLGLRDYLVLVGRPVDINRFVTSTTTHPGPASLES